MKLVVLLAAAVAATPVEHPEPESKSPLVQAARDSKTPEAGADREGKCK